MAFLHVGEAVGSGFLGFAEEVLWHGFVDTLKLIPFLFLTYLLMEFIEHSQKKGLESFVSRSGALGPLFGAALGAVPQCGFSAAAANLFTGRVITVGTLIAVFLSTSDEMIPILLGGSVKPTSVVLIVVYKLAVAALVGLLLDFILKLFGKEREEVNIDELCERDNCHCERGILFSALHHTVTITVFVFIVTLFINAAVYFVGEDRLGDIIGYVPFLSHLLCSFVGLIPNCAASVLLSSLFVDGIISGGAMISGLFSGAGVGLIILLRVNKHTKENALIVSVILGAGFVFGVLFDLLPFAV